MSDIAYHVAEAAAAKQEPDLLLRLYAEMHFRDARRHARIMRFTIAGLTGTKKYDLK